MTRSPRSQPRPPRSTARRIGAGLLGAFLVFAGASHLGFARKEFAQLVPAWVPADPDAVVVQSGVLEIALGAGVLALPASRARWGWAAAALFVVVFPANLDQVIHRKDAFGLDSDAARLGRLAFQPLLVLWALWSTGAWREVRAVASRPRDATR